MMSSTSRWGRLKDGVAVLPPEIVLAGTHGNDADVLPAHAVLASIERDGIQADGDVIPIRQQCDERPQLRDGDHVTKAGPGSRRSRRTSSREPGWVPRRPG
jgi:hypothetical protein